MSTIKKVSMENVTGLADEFTHLIDKIGYLLREIGSEGVDDDLVVCLAFDALENSKKKSDELWEKIKADNCKPDPEKIEIPKDIFDNDRLWEYVAQIQIDKHDPADVLEAWMKEHNPEYFEN